MASILPGYEYDIFISYRHNDNKGDKWVTNFIQALQDELDATLKEQISIYFDENPHDGLLETHDVDKSLEKKLKCLIFIPIISQTYCDPNCFAWQNELTPFVELAKEDKIGLSILLASGNVANRVLPIHIHEIENNDVALFEQVTGITMRSIDFIYKAKGVNRPLLPKIDDKESNQYSTVYRDQINKVANAIKEIITSIRVQYGDGAETAYSSVKSVIYNLDNRKNTTRLVPILLGALAILLMGFVGYWLVNRNNSNKNMLENKSIAVLYFDNMSGDPEQEYFSDGITEEIIARLTKIEGLRVISRTSTRVYKGQARNLKKIAKELNVSVVLEGSFRKSGNQIKVVAQLIDAQTDEHIWAETFQKELKDIFQVQSDIAHEIAKKFEIEVAAETELKIEKQITSNTEAYDYYLRARHIAFTEVYYNWDSVDFLRSKMMYEKAIQLDTNFAEAYAGLADLYDATRRQEIFTPETDSTRHALSWKAYLLDSNSAFVNNVRIWALLNREEPLGDSAFYHAKKSLGLDPNDHYNYQSLGLMLFWHGLYDLAIPYYEKAVNLSPLTADYYAALGFCYWMTANTEKAEKFFQSAYELEQNKRYSSKWATIIWFICQEEHGKAKLLINNMDFEWIRLDAYQSAVEGDEAKALNIATNNLSGPYLELFYAITAIKGKSLEFLSSDLENKANNYLILKNLDAWEPYFSDPKYQETLKAYRIKHEENKRKYAVDINDFVKGKGKGN